MSDIVKRVNKLRLLRSFEIFLMIMGCACLLAIIIAVQVSVFQGVN